MIAATSTVIQDIVDNADERELWIVGREFERPPYFIAGKGGDTRLARALRLCIDEKIAPNSDGSYQVEGSHGRSYRVADSCSCPNSQKASTKYCYHFVAVCLYVEWQKRLRPTAPVALGTLRAGTLPLPPVTVDERLAQAVPNFQAIADQLEQERLAEAPPEADLPLIAHREEGPVYTTASGTRYTMPEGEILQDDAARIALGTLPLPPVTVEERLAQPVMICETPDCTLPAVDLRAGHPVCEGHRAVIDGRVAQRLALGAIHDNTALSTHHTPQEDRMADNEYIPEPEMDDAPVAILERPVPEPARVTAAVAAGQALLPALEAQTLERSMQAYAAQRAVVTRYIKEQMTEGVDYYTLTIKGRVSKATLSKAGSEKFLSLFQLHAAFQQDEATWRMLGSKDGLLCYTCTLMTRSGEVIGEGRGARSVSQDGGDINKAIKMATKSAQVDAVLRTGALSDVFTQDLESDEEPAKAAAPVKPNPLHPAAELRQRIWAKVRELAPDARTREAVEAFIKERTGMDLHPDFYEAILARLEGRA